MSEFQIKKQNQKTWITRKPHKEQTVALVQFPYSPELTIRCIQPGGCYMRW